MMPLPIDEAPDLPPVYRAVIEGDTAGLNALLVAGADPNAPAHIHAHVQSHRGPTEETYVLITTPLQTATDRGLTDAVRLLLEHGASVKARRPQDRFTPLHSAALFGALDIVRLLLDHRAPVNARTIGRQTPLYLAADRQHIAVARLLLERGANPSLMPNFGRTALALAVYRVNAELVDLLLEFSADPNQGGGALAEAAEQERPDLMARLFAAGASIEAWDAVGRTPLFRAVYDGSAPAVGLLLAAGADPNAGFDVPGKDAEIVWMTPLRQAILRDAPDIVDLLLSHGAKAETDDGWKTALPLRAPSNSGGSKGASRRRR